MLGTQQFSASFRLPLFDVVRSCRASPGLKASTGARQRYTSLTSAAFPSTTATGALYSQFTAAITMFEVMRVRVESDRNLGV